MTMEYTYKYPRPAVTADCIVMTREAEPKVLLIQTHLAFDHYDIMQDAIALFKAKMNIA